MFLKTFFATIFLILILASSFIGCATIVHAQHNDPNSALNKALDKYRGKDNKKPAVCYTFKERGMFNKTRKPNKGNGQCLIPS